MTMSDVVEPPAPGSIWRHSRGGEYRIAGPAILEREWQEAVMYLPLNHPGRVPVSLFSHWSGTLYMPVTARPIVRELGEFMDGRFTLIRSR